MKKNESTADRIIRVILGIIILYSAYAWLSGWLVIVGYLIGIILVLTAITGYCALYNVCSSGCKKSMPEKEESQNEEKIE